MAKKLNKNLVIALTGVGFVLTTAAGILMVYSFQEKDPAEFERKAKEYAEAKDWNRAALYYRKAYAAGEDTKYLILAGDMVYESGEEIKALSYYQNAINIDPQLLEAQEKTMDLLLEIAQLNPGYTENWTRLDEVASAILELENQSEHPKATYAKGLALIRTKDIDPRNEAKGFEYLKKAVSLDPDNVEYVRSLAVYYASQGEGQFAEAVNILADLVDRSTTPGENAAKARCYYAMVLIAGSNPDYDRAVELLEEASKLSGDDPEVQSFVQNQIGSFWFGRWADHRNANGPDDPQAIAAFEKAEQALRRSIEIEPEGYRSYLQLATLLKYNQQFEDAIVVCDKRLDGPHSRRGFQAAQTRAAIYALRLELATIKTMLAEQKPEGSSERDEILADAELEVEDALAEAPTGAEAHYRLGRIRFAQGRYPEAIKFFEKASELSPRIDPDTMFYLSHARLRLGQNGAARDAIVKAISVRNPQPRDWIQYGRILLKLGEPAEAREAVEQVLRNDPGNAEALLVKAGALDKLGESDQALQLLGGIKSESPKVVAAKAVTKAEKGDGEEAISDLLPYLEKDPTNYDLVSGMVAVYKKLDRTADAQRLLDATVAKVEDPYAFELLRLHLEQVSEEEFNQRHRELAAATSDEYSRAIRMAAFLQASDPENVEGQLEQYAKAKALINEGATEEAKKAGERGLRAIIARMFELAVFAKDDEMIESLVREAEKHDADGAGGLSYRGRQLVQQGLTLAQKARETEGDEADSLEQSAKGKFDDAINILQEALEAYPSSSSTHAALGDAYFSTQRFGEAKIAYQRSNEIAPDNPRVVRQLAILAQRTGDDAALKAWLEKCKTLIPNDPWVKDQLLLQQETENPEDGIAKRTKLLEQDPNDVANLSALANLYRQIGDAEKCQEMVAKMLEIQSDTRTIPFAANILRAVGKGGEALGVLKRFLREAPRDEKPLAQLLIAHHYQQLRDFGQAELAFLAAADIDPSVDVCVAIATFYYEMRRYASAKEWYDRAYEAAGPGSPQQAEIRRVQIDTLLRLDRVDEAAALAEAYRQESPDDPYVIFYESQVAARSGNMEEALDKLGRFIEMKPRDPIARYRMAQYLASRGDWQQASSILEDLRAIDPLALQYAPRVLLSQAYAMTGRMDLSLQELENIVQSDPDATPVAEELINRLVSARRYADAEQVITTMINRHPGQTRWLIRNADLAMMQFEAQGANQAQKQHHRNAAIRDLKKAVNMSGFEEKPTFRLLAVLLNLNAADEGVKYFEEQVPPNRRTAKLLTVYARLLANQGKQAAAADAYRFALLRSEFKSMEMIFTELIPFIKGSFGANAAKIFAEKPENPMLARANDHLVAILAMVDGDHTGAVEKFEDLLADAKTDEEKASIIFLKGYTLGLMGRNQEAKEAYDQVLALVPEHEMALNNIAYLLTDELGQPEQALDYARKAASLNASANVLDTLGWAYVKAGRLKDGIGRLSQARQMDSMHIAAAYHLGEAYRLSGDFENAAKVLKEAIQSPSKEYVEYKKLAAEALEKTQNGISN